MSSGNFLAPPPSDPSVRAEFKKRKFDFEEYDAAAAHFFYKVRQAGGRSDVKVICCFYFPDADKDICSKMYFPASKYFPISPSYNFLAVVCCYGSRTRRKLVGYLPVKEVRGKFKIIPKGTRLGPKKTDKSWEDMYSIGPEFLTPMLPDKSAAAASEATVGPFSTTIGTLSGHGMMIVADLDDGIKIEAKDHRRGTVKDLFSGKQDDAKPDDAEEKTTAIQPALAVGQRLDVKYDGVWYAAQVVDTRPGVRGLEVKVHYDEFDASHDNWISAEGEHVAPLGAFSTKRPKSTGFTTSTLVPKDGTTTEDGDMATVGSTATGQMSVAEMQMRLLALEEENKKLKSKLKP